MNRKIGLTIALFMFLTCAGSVLSEVSVGVKKGDWAEYQVDYTGTPPEGHDVIRAKMKIKDIQGKRVYAEITVEFFDETNETMTTTLDLETGQLGDDFIVPADLNSGDTFFDNNAGNITINNIEEKTYAGATRTVAHSTTPETSYYWDRSTGVLVEGNSSLPGYTVNTIVTKTNLWQPQIFGLDPPVFYALMICAAMFIIMLAFLIVKRKK